MTATLATISKNIGTDGQGTTCGDLNGTTTGTPLGHPSATTTRTGEQGIDINITISSTGNGMATIVVGSTTWLGPCTRATITSTTCSLSTNKACQSAFLFTGTTGVEWAGTNQVSRAGTKFWGVIQATTTKPGGTTLTTSKITGNHCG